MIMPIILFVLSANICAFAMDFAFYSVTGRRTVDLMNEYKDIGTFAKILATVYICVNFPAGWLGNRLLTWK